MATIEGMVFYPSREGMTNGLPSFTAAAAELVVPRSIPIIAPLVPVFAGPVKDAAGVGCEALGGGWVMTGGASFGSAGRVDALGGGGGVRPGDGAAVIPLRLVMSTFGDVAGGVAGAGGIGRASIFRAGGGFPPSSAMIVRPTSSAPRICSRIPASV